MTDQVLVAGEFHRFEAADRTYVYLVPSAAVFALDDTALSVLDTVAAGAGTRDSSGRSCPAGPIWWRA